MREKPLKRFKKSLCLQVCHRTNPQGNDYKIWCMVAVSWVINMSVGTDDMVLVTNTGEAN